MEKYILKIGCLMILTLLLKLLWIKYIMCDGEIEMMISILGSGSLPSITLGYGALVDRYSNSLEYPQVKKIGLNLIAGNDKVKFEYIHSDFKSTPGLMALETKFNLSSRSNVFINIRT